MASPPLLSSPTALPLAAVDEGFDEPMPGVLLVWSLAPDFGAFIRSRREELHLSISKAAKLMPASATYLRLIEQGEGPSKPTHELCTRLAWALSLDFRVLLEAAGGRYALPQGALAAAAKQFRARVGRLLFHERLARPSFTTSHMSALPDVVLGLYHDLAQRVDTNARVEGPSVRHVLDDDETADSELLLRSPSDCDTETLRQAHAQPQPDLLLVWLPSTGFGSHLKHLRSGRALSVRAAAAELDLSPSYVSTLEGGEGPEQRRFELCADFARAYEADLGDLLHAAGARIAQRPRPDEVPPATAHERLRRLLSHDRFEVHDFDLGILRYVSDFIARDLILFTISVDENGRTSGPPVFEIVQEPS